MTDTWDMVMERGAAKNIMLVPGKLFAPSEDVMQNESPYMRASYSIADVAKFDLGQKSIELRHHFQHSFSTTVLQYNLDRIFNMSFTC